MNLREWLDQPGNTQTKLAEKIGVTQGLVSQWLNWLEGRTDNACRLLAERAIEIELATEGAVTRQELRPDLFGDKPVAAQP